MNLKDSVAAARRRLEEYLHALSETHSFLRRFALGETFRQQLPPEEFDSFEREVKEHNAKALPGIEAEIEKGRHALALLEAGQFAPALKILRVCRAEQLTTLLHWEREGGELIKHNPLYLLHEKDLNELTAAIEGLERHT